jgi:hypothetical protein
MIGRGLTSSPRQSRATTRHLFDSTPASRRLLSGRPAGGSTTRSLAEHPVSAFRIRLLGVDLYTDCTIVRWVYAGDTQARLAQGPRREPDVEALDDDVDTPYRMIGSGGGLHGTNYMRGETPFLPAVPTSARLVRATLSDGSVVEVGLA